MSEEKNPILAEIEMRAREDAERERRIQGIKEKREISNARKTVLSKMKKGELVELINGAWPDLDEYKKEKLSWKNIPFIPEDLGFKEHETMTKERGIVRIYFRAGLAITKLPSQDFDYDKEVKEGMRINGKWRFKTLEGDKVIGTMEFLIPDKYTAFQILRTLGIKFDGSESTVVETEIDFDKILGEEEE